MKKIIMSLFVIIFISITPVFASQLAYSSFDNGRITELIEIYSDENITAYIGEDAVMANLIYGQYRENGKFKVRLYVRFNTENLRDTRIKSLNAYIENNEVDFLHANSSGLKYIAYEIFRDPTINSCIIHSELYFNDYSLIIGSIDTLICMRRIENNYDLGSNKGKSLTLLIQCIGDELDRLKSNPKYNSPY